MTTDRAKALAVEREMDLVEVAPQAQPPVARIMDYGKFKFESIKKEKDGRRKHNVIKVKEMKLRPKIGEHDFQTKFNAVKSFLAEGDKVKLTIMFRGREMVHQDIGKKLLDRMAVELKTISTVERMPLLEGRNMIMILAPAAAAAQAPPPAAQAQPPAAQAQPPAQAPVRKS
jgi:translation initiation factor IF-3